MNKRILFHNCKVLQALLVLEVPFFFFVLGKGSYIGRKNKGFLKSTGVFAKERWLVHLVHSQLDIVPCGYHHLAGLRDDLFMTKFSLSTRGK